MLLKNNKRMLRYAEKEAGMAESLNDVVGLIYMTIEISVSKIEYKNSIGVG